MSRPIKPAYEVGKLAGILTVLAQELHLANRVGLDTYSHFGIVVNWRKVLAMTQACLSFEIILACLFSGKGWSIFGPAFELGLVKSISVVTTLAVFTALFVSSFGLWRNTHWGFLIQAFLLTIFDCIGAGGFIYFLIEGSAAQLVIYLLCWVVAIVLTGACWSRSTATKGRNKAL